QALRLFRLRSRLRVAQEPSQYVLRLPPEQQGHLLLERRAVPLRPLALDPVLQAPKGQGQKMQAVRRRGRPRLQQPLVGCPVEQVVVLRQDEMVVHRGSALTYPCQVATAAGRRQAGGPARPAPV